MLTHNAAKIAIAIQIFSLFRSTQHRLQSSAHFSGFGPQSRRYNAKKMWKMRGKTRRIKGQKARKLNA